MPGVLGLSAENASDVPFIVRGIGENGFPTGFLGCGFYAGFFYDVEAVGEGVSVAEGKQVGEGGAPQTAGDGFDVVAFCGLFGCGGAGVGGCVR